MTDKPLSPNYKWYIMILGLFTNGIVVAMPGIALSVLLPAISRDLHLSLVQAGLLWGMGSLPTIISSLLVGPIIDRFGPRRVLIAGCILVGLTGAMRGLLPGYAFLMLAGFLFGLFAPLVTFSNFKNAALWFPHDQQGLANGIATLGMAAGFFGGSMISASILSPALGGWQYVFFFYGAVALVFILPWLFSRPAPAPAQAAGTSAIRVSVKDSLRVLARSRNMWALSLANMAFSGGAQGIIGYVPLFLQGKGWPVSSAGGVLGVFNIASMIVVLPLSLLSDRLGSKRNILIGASILSATGISLLSFVNGAGVWIAIMMSGAVRDAFVAITLASIYQNGGVSREYSSMALGFMMVFMGLGSLVAPPLGNSLATLAHPGAPMVFWAGLVLLGGALLFLLPRRDAVSENLIAAIPEEVSLG